MPVTDALILRNWFPLPYAVTMRKGWKEITVGMTPGENATVAVHSPAVGADKPVVFTGGKIYVIGAPGVAPAPLVTGLANDYWQTTMYSNAGGNYLYCVNGFDSPRYYDGTAFTIPALTSVEPGFNANDLIHVAIHQRRLWFVKKNSMEAFFLPVDQIAGALEVFPVGQLFKFGGFLMAIYTWTVDSGDGMNDKLVFISSKGEIAIYSGLDPEDATQWSLDGVYRVGSPVGRRCGASYGGDLLVITTDGVVPLSRALQSTKVNSADNLTDKVQHTISALVSQFKDVVGWQMLLFQNENQVWLVVPTSLAVSPANSPTQRVSETVNVQIYAMNTISGAWAQYTNMDVRSCCLFMDNPIFVTGDGRLIRAWTGYFDNVPWDGSIGERIRLELLTAYNYFNALGQTKRWTLARPIFQAGTIPESAIRLEIDFAVTGVLVLVPPLPPPSSDSVWDLARWDEARWNTEFQRYRRWQSVQGMGYAAALHLLIAQNVETTLVAIDYVYETGATI